jgi:hypothetical protein
MKIKFDVEIDTTEDKAIGEEIIDLLGLLKERLEWLAEQEYEE